MRGEIRALDAISMRVIGGWLDLEQTMYRESSLVRFNLLFSSAQHHSHAVKTLMAKVEQKVAQPSCISE
jgi:hypothetical protein